MCSLMFIEIIRMSPNTFDTVSLYYTVPTLALMTVYSLYWFVRVLFTTRFTWVKIMLFLCVTQNATTTWI